MLLKEKFCNHRILLASQSPRRKKLLAGLDLPFTVIPLNTQEIYPKELKEEEITEFLCNLKSKSYSHWSENDILITADTIVWMNGKAREKPQSRQEAIEMLSAFSGKMHQVITSVGVFSPEKQVIFTDKTLVKFSDLTQEEIEFYVDNFQPFDKAGAYGIQEWIGYVGIERIEGSYFNVMGLPVHELYQALKNF